MGKAELWCQGPQIPSMPIMAAVASMEDGTGILAKIPLLDSTWDFLATLCQACGIASSKRLLACFPETLLWNRHKWL